MKTPEIYIENYGKGKHVGGIYTHVYLLREDEDGNEEKIDISSCVRGVDVRLHVDEVVTAKLEVMITGVSTRADAEEVILATWPKRPWMRRHKLVREITSLSSRYRQYARLGA